MEALREKERHDETQFTIWSNSCKQGDKRCSSTFVVLALSNNDPLPISILLVDAGKHSGEIFLYGVPHS